MCFYITSQFKPLLLCLVSHCSQSQLFIFCTGGGNQNTFFFYFPHTNANSYSHFTGGTGTSDCTDVTATLRMCSDAATLFCFLCLCSKTEAKKLSRFQLLSLQPSALLLLSLLFLDTSCSRKRKGFTENEDGIVHCTVGSDLNTANTCTTLKLLQSW